MQQELTLLALLPLVQGKYAVGIVSPLVVDADEKRFGPCNRLSMLDHESDIDDFFCPGLLDSIDVSKGDVSVVVRLEGRLVKLFEFNDDSDSLTGEEIASYLL